MKFGKDIDGHTMNVSIKFRYFPWNTDRTLIRSEEGPKGLAAPLTAYMAQTILSFPVVVDTLGGYNWRHHGDI